VSYALKVDVKPTSEGWIFTCGNRHAGPYRDLDSLDPVKVAALLSGLGQEDIEEWKQEPGLNREKWIVKPKDVLAAKIMVENCLSLKAQKAEAPSLEAFSTHISKIDASLAGRLVKVNAQIVSEQSQKALPQRLIISCSRCGAEAEADLLKAECIGLLEAVVFKQKGMLRQRALAWLNNEEGSTCETETGHKVQVEESGHVDYAVLGVRDLLEEMEKFDQHVYQSRRVHLVGAKVPQSKRVCIEGYVVVEPINRDLCLLAYKIEPLETQVAGFQVTPEDCKEWTKWFNPEMDIKAQIAPDMVGRENVQYAYLLVLHSVPEIPDIHGKIIRGCLRALLFGDTKTYKSESGKDLTINHYGFGGYVVAESSSRTGITYTIDTENKAIVWGELPNNDLGLTVIDGLHAMFSEEMKELRESLENQRITVRRFVSGDALARTRVIGIFNPNKPMNQYVYPCMALKDNSAFYDPPDLTRWDIFIPFSKEDVSEEAIAARTPRQRPVPEQVFKRHVYWAWSRKPEHIRYSEAAKGLIIEASVELMQEYVLSSLPVVHLGIRDVLCRLSVAQACLEHSTDETHTLVIVDLSHVKKALAFYKDMLDKLHLREYKIEEEGRLEISPGEFEEMVGKLTERQLAILNSVKIQSKSSGVLAEELGVSVDTIQRDYKTLRGFGLITTSPRVGITLTARGVQFLKLLREGNIRIPAKNADIRIILSVSEKLSLVLGKARELAREGLVSKFDVADALSGRLPRDEIFQLLQQLEKEGKLAPKGPEWYLVV
jgi:biotin operon repressor